MATRIAAAALFLLIPAVPALPPVPAATTNTATSLRHLLRRRHPSFRARYRGSPGAAFAFLCRNISETGQDAPGIAPRLGLSAVGRPTPPIKIAGALAFPTMNNKATMAATPSPPHSPPPRRSTRMRRSKSGGGPASPTSVMAVSSALDGGDVFAASDDIPPPGDRHDATDRSAGGGPGGEGSSGAASGAKRPYAVAARAAKGRTGRRRKAADTAAAAMTAGADESSESARSKSTSRSKKSPRGSPAVVSGRGHAAAKARGGRGAGGAETGDDRDLVLHSDDLAGVSPQNRWVDLGAPPCELRPSRTLATGQSFNWLVVDTSSPSPSSIVADGDDDAPSTPTRTSAWGTHGETEWVGPLSDHVVSIRETPSTTLCRVLAGPPDTADFLRDMRDHFQLDVPLGPLYERWSSSDERMARVASCLPGVRVMRQDPVEALFSFICSSNNNIPRISLILGRLRESYGERLIDLPRRGKKDGDDAASSSPPPPPPPPLAVHAFPTLDQLLPATESSLREMGWGYRARYVVETRDHLLAGGGSDYLHSLRGELDSSRVQEELLSCSGVGRKVADCVGLFSLDRTDAIPVDVHVSRIAERDYDPSGTVYSMEEGMEDGGEDGDVDVEKKKKEKKRRKVVKSLTPTVYRRVGDLFRDRFGSHAGWAHSLLFAAELPSFRSALPDDVVSEMDRFKEEGRAKKLLEREQQRRGDGGAGKNNKKRR